MCTRPVLHPLSMLSSLSLVGSAPPLRPTIHPVRRGATAALGRGWWPGGTCAGARPFPLQQVHDAAYAAVLADLAGPKPRVPP